METSLEVKILTLLAAGFLVGPNMLAWVNPDAIFGDVLLPIVGLSVAILLFEGGLKRHVEGTAAGGS